MKQQQQPYVHPPWSWPLDLDAYDRTPDLSSPERRELAQKMSPSRTQLQKKSWGSLSRLFQPLDDALTSLENGPPYNTQKEVIRVMAVEMDRRGTAFWGWPVEEWFESMTASNAAFAERYGWERLPEHVRSRFLIPALAYLLCPSLPPDPFLERLLVAPFARKLFGPARPGVGERSLSSIPGRGGVLPFDNNGRRRPGLLSWSLRRVAH